ncbi:MAG: LPS export ABC transporter periplasmic protein LptC [Firmicutes bacterium]|nr:LPS export ABC transporter periplasmic protein LptC [Bacillota bacterium]
MGHIRSFWRKAGFIAGFRRLSLSGERWYRRAFFAVFIIVGGIFIWCLAYNAWHPGRHILSDTGASSRASSKIAGSRDESGNVAAPDSEHVGKDAGPGITVKGGKIILTNPSGEVEWEMKADKIEASDDAMMASIYGVEAAKYSEGKEISRVKAAKAVVSWEKRTLSFDEGVSATTPSGERFEAGRASWDGTQNTIIFGGGVRYKGPTVALASNTLTVDDRFHLVKTMGPGKVTILRSRPAGRAAECPTVP